MRVSEQPSQLILEYRAAVAARANANANANANGNGSKIKAAEEKPCEFLSALTCETLTQIQIPDISSLAYYVKRPALFTANNGEFLVVRGNPTTNNDVGYGLREARDLVQRNRMILPKVKRVLVIPDRFENGNHFGPLQRAEWL